MRYCLPLAFLVCLLMDPTCGWARSVQVFPAPGEEELSKDFTVEVEGKPVPVYVAKVAPADREKRWKAMDDKARSADYFEKASFSYFDMEGPVRVTVNGTALSEADVKTNSFVRNIKIEQ